jgi:ribose transport system substrate-binding protein
VPFIAQATNSTAGALKQAGVTAQQYPSQGQLSQIQQAFGNAISAKDDAIGLFSVSPGTIGPQLTASANAGVPAVIGHVTPNGTPLAPHAAAQTTGPFDEAARLMADYVIANSKGHADVLVVTSNEQMPAPGMVKAINDELHKYCGSGCATTTVNVAIADWAQKLQSQVQSSLIANPKINYILPLFDSGVQFVLPGITAAGATNRVKVATFNGTPFVLDDIAKGNIVIADVGESTRWLGRALADQLFRVVTGTTPLVNEHTPYRIFDKSNVNDAGSPAQLGQGYGSGDISGYNKVWGLS